MVIDYRREDTQRDNEAEQAKELYDQGLLNKAIAAKLGCSRNWVTKLLKHWHRSRGLAMVDGRKRRSTLARKQVPPTMYEKLADEAKALWDEGLSDLQIAAHLNCSPPTAESAVDHWHRSRGLEAPSHADRRDALLERMKDLYDQNYSFRDIAKVVGVCTRSVTQLLRERFTRDGKDLPDGRRRRRSTN